MEPFAMFVIFSYLIGAVGSTSVLRARAGVGIWKQMKIFGDNGFGPVWLATATLLSLVWPLTLLLWLMRGRPEPRVVFNEKAEERRRRQAAERAAG